MGKHREIKLVSLISWKYMHAYIYIYSIHLYQKRGTNVVTATNRCVNDVFHSILCGDFWEYVLENSRESGSGKRWDKARVAQQVTWLFCHSVFIILQRFPPDQLVFSLLCCLTIADFNHPLSPPTFNPLGALVMRVHVKHFRVSATKTFFWLLLLFQKPSAHTHTHTNFEHSIYRVFQFEALRWQGNLIIDRWIERSQLPAS